MWALSSQGFSIADSAKGSAFKTAFLIVQLFARLFFPHREPEFLQLSGGSPRPQREDIKTMPSCYVLSLAFHSRQSQSLSHRTHTSLLGFFIIESISHLKTSPALMPHFSPILFRYASQPAFLYLSPCSLTLPHAASLSFFPSSVINAP